MFNEAIVPLSLIRIALFTAASRFIAVPMTYLCQGLAGTRFALVLVLLPLLSLGCLALAFRSLPERERVVRPYPKFSYPWKPLAVLCIYAFAYGMRTAQLPEGPASIPRFPPRSSWAGSSSSYTFSPIASR